MVLANTTNTLAGQFSVMRIKARKFKAQTTGINRFYFPQLV
jgi:hypothetical protein